MTDNTSYQFLDTNILVYAHDESAGKKHQKAKALVQKLWNSKTGCLSIQVLQEFHVTITKKVANPLDIDTAIRVIEDLSFWKIFVPEAKDVLVAIDLQRRYMISFWDAMIIWSAIQLNCEILWSEDLNSSQFYENTQVINPFQG